MKRMKPSRVWLAILTTLVLVGVGGMGSVEAQEPGSALFGRAHLSTGVIKNGAPHALVEGTRIRVRFAHSDEGDRVRWRSGCNYYGAEVDVTAEHLNIGVIGSTAVACSKPLNRQDKWVARFFGSNPRWVRHGRRLKLMSADDVIKLRRRA
jgi:hypothetical protein